MSFVDKMKRKKFLPFTLLAFTLSAGILIGTLVNTGVHAAKDGQSVAPDATPLVIPKSNVAENEFTKIAKAAEPSVVNISTDYTPKPSSARRNRPPQDDEDMDEDQQQELFRRFFGGRAPQNMPMPKRFGTGSGFIVDKNGYIITNYHVVEKADHVKVKFQDDPTEHKAKVIGFDKEIDMAVLKIDAGRSLPYLKIGNSEAVQVGDWAVAIGSPFGLEATVTAGIVSAKGRNNVGQQFQSFIQTDAAINPGNSGGPLLNINGEVIGINTAIATDSGGSQGVGFALPVNTAAKSYNQIIRSGRVTRGSIGITFGRDPKPELMKALGTNGGVLVAEVTPDGPAAKAGIKPDDILIAMNGKPLKNGEELVARVADTPVGEAVKMTVDRTGSKKEINVTIADRTEVFANRPNVGDNRPEPSKGESASQAKFGIAILNLGDAERERMALEDKGGVQVTRVEPDSFAEEIGLQEKDIIVSINRLPVATVDDVRKLQQTIKPGDAVAFRVMRAFGARMGGAKPTWQTFFLAGTLPK